MRPAVACIAVVLPSVAVAEPVARVDLGTSFVSGPITPGAFNPALRFGLGGTVGAELERTDFRASWGVHRDQVGCDTCGDGAGPGLVGRELLGSTDLSLSTGYRRSIGEASLRVAATLVVPASRDALACNPLYGAPGVSGALAVPAGASSVRLSATGARPIYRYDSVPVGLCAPALADEDVATLSGPATPTPWGGARPGMPNPTATAGIGVAWSDPHALLVEVPRLTTGVSLGLEASRHAAADAVTIRTATGPVTVDRARAPFVAGVPWSLSAGLALADHSDLSFSVADRVPTLLADPGGTLRALPGRTAFTLTVSGHL